MSLGERLLQLRKDSGLDRAEVAKILGIPYNTLSNYENDERDPRHTLLIQFADLYRVSTDYLLCRTDIKTMPNDVIPVESSSLLDDASALSSEDLDEVHEIIRMKLRKANDKSDQKDNKKVTLESLRKNPPRRYAASSSNKADDDMAAYLHKQLEAINEEEAKGNWE